MTLFEKGRPKTGGRAKGAKNRLSHAFLTALAEDFEQHGIEALKIARIERPVEYIKVVAGLMPKEFEIMDSCLAVGVAARRPTRDAGGSRGCPSAAIQGAG